MKTINPLHKEILEKFGTVNNFSTQSGTSQGEIYRWLKLAKYNYRIRNLIDSTQAMPLLSKQQMCSLFRKRFNNSYVSLGAKIQDLGGNISDRSLHNFFSKKSDITRFGKRYQFIYKALVSEKEVLTAPIKTETNHESTNDEIGNSGID